MREPLPIALSDYLGGNPVSLIVRFQSEARRAGWGSDEIGEIVDEAQSGDYFHLIETLEPYLEL